MDRLRELLLGCFTGVDQLHASPWSAAETAPVAVDSTAELGGTLIAMRVTETRSAGSFTALNMLMTDRDTGEVLLYGFDNFGYRPEPPARGGFQDAELVLDRSTVRGDSRVVFRATSCGFAWAKQFRPSADQPWQPVVTGSLRRAAPAGLAGAGPVPGD